ncbi:MAG: NADPH-dependent glutamate synthase [Planctomycetes bacterium]|jgi:glutamate synthase (NADPH/NADH) small chain|nr:NADPH-dependent glutamate synthase [Planctomycetota bacterium]
MTADKKPSAAGRVPMREQDPHERSTNFQEVPLGYSPEEAVAEAARCLVCKKPKCVEGCPVNVDIPGFVALVKEGKFLEAARRVKTTNVLPAVCGRVCPQESQCEGKCVKGKKGEPVAVGNLERFVADYEAARGAAEAPKLPPRNGKRIAVVGSGPAGLTVAGDLIQLGYEVTIFEALHKTGGVLVYGIPEFRLPKAIVQREVDYLASLGVEVRTGEVVGATVTVPELLGPEGYHAVFVGVGAGLPQFLKIPGENLNGVFSANEYLTRANLMKAYLFPEVDTPIKKARRVAVFGGGNVAMDSARNALRLGAEVHLMYRRSREEMPARAAEIHHAEQEGIHFDFLTNPVRFLGTDKGFLKAVEAMRMELGAPDESGRRRPVPVPNSNFELEVDVAVVAIGTSSNPLLSSTTPGLKLNQWGYIVADEETGATSLPGVYAGGDIVTGSATVILAMGAGRKAARAMHAFCQAH